MSHVQKFSLFSSPCSHISCLFGVSFCSTIAITGKHPLQSKGKEVYFQQNN